MLNLQLIATAIVQVLRHIHRESEVTTPVESSFLAVDKDGGLIINGTKVEQDILAVPGLRHLECGREP